MIVRIYRLDYSGFQDPSQWATDIDDEIRANAAAKTPFHDAWAAVLASVRPGEARQHFVHFTERMMDYLSCVRMINLHPMSAYQCVVDVREGVANIYATYSDLRAMGVDENSWPNLNVRMSRTAVQPPLPSNREQQQCPSTCICAICVWRRAPPHRRASKPSKRTTSTTDAGMRAPSCTATDRASSARIT